MKKILSLLFVCMFVSTQCFAELSQEEKEEIKGYLEGEMIYHLPKNTAKDRVEKYILENNGYSYKQCRNKCTNEWADNRVRQTRTGMWVLGSASQQQNAYDTSMGCYNECEKIKQHIGEMIDYLKSL